MQEQNKVAAIVVRTIHNLPLANTKKDIFYLARRIIELTNDKIGHSLVLDVVARQGRHDPHPQQRLLCILCLPVNAILRIHLLQTQAAIGGGAGHTPAKSHPPLPLDGLRRVAPNPILLAMYGFS